MKITFLTLAFALCGIHANAFNPSPGDTVVVKMKNKNKVIIMTDKNKDLESLKGLKFEKIMMKIDSSLGNLDSLKNLRINVDMQDSDTIIENLPGGKKRMMVKTIKVMGRDSEIESEDLDLGKMKIKTIKVMGSDAEIPSDEEKMVKIIIRDGDTLRREFIRRKSDKSPKVSFFKNNGTDDDLFELDLGFNNYLERGSLPGDKGAAYGLIPFNSNIVNLRWMKRVVGQAGKTRLSGAVGLEFSWNNYKFDQNVIIGKNSAGVTFDSFDAGQKKIKSKLTISWVNVPLMLHYNSRKSSFHMAVGGFAGYRLGSHNKIKFTEDGVTKKEKEYTNFYLNSLQYGLRFQVGFYDVDFFASYNLNELFSSGKGPKLTPFSFGITL